MSSTKKRATNKFDSLKKILRRKLEIFEDDECCENRCCIRCRAPKKFFIGEKSRVFSKNKLLKDVLSDDRKDICDFVLFTFRNHRVDSVFIEFKSNVKLKNFGKRTIEKAINQINSTEKYLNTLCDLKGINKHYVIVVKNDAMLAKQMGKWIKKLKASPRPKIISCGKDVVSKVLG